MIEVIIVVVIAFLAVGILLARQSSTRKKDAIRSLEAEKEAMGSKTIADMVHDEVRDLRLREIAGSQDLSSEVLLKVWTASEGVRAKCDFENLRYTVREGIPLTEVRVEDVDLICTSPSEPAAAEDTDEPADA